MIQQIYSNIRTVSFLCVIAKFYSWIKLAIIDNRIYCNKQIFNTTKTTIYKNRPNIYIKIFNKTCYTEKNVLVHNHWFCWYVTKLIYFFIKKLCCFNRNHFWWLHINKINAYIKYFFHNQCKMAHIFVTVMKKTCYVSNFYCNKELAELAY